MDELQRVRFMIDRFYWYRTRNPILGDWYIRELLTPSRVCEACGMFWYDGCGR